MNIETEFEAKFYSINKEEFRKELKKLGAILKIPERKMKRMVADRRANPQLKYGYIRVRDEGNLIRLSVKETAEQNGKLSDQKEVDIIVSDFNKTVQIIECCGIKFNRFQETLREEWEFMGAQITIDTWPALDSLCEVESDSEEKVKEIAEKLDFDWNKKIITAAAEVYVRVYKLNIEEVLDKISYISFKKNPFKGLKKHKLVYN